MQDKKKIVIGTLCALIMIMAVGYALLSQQLSINGSASITSNWQVEITNITEKEKSTGVTTNNTNYTATTASFNTSLTSPGDYALYEVTVTNKGTLDAVLAAKPTITTGNNEAIQYELEGIKKGDKILKNNQTDTFTIKVQYNLATTSQPTTLTSNIELTLNYEQDLGQVEPEGYYSVGDIVSYKGSDWYVIDTSTVEQDYVTLIKENVLTAEEIGNKYSYKGTSGVAENKMAYNWTWGCHTKGIFGLDNYNGSDSTGCSNVNSYYASKIKKSVEEYMINYLDSSDLKDVDGYKIRLITKDEYEALENSIDNSSDWLYNSTLGSYWTMTPEDDIHVYFVFTFLNSQRVYAKFGVRPVINLLKSAIE